MGCDYNKLTAATLFTPKLTAGKSNATSFKHLVLGRIFSLKLYKFSIFPLKLELVENSAKDNISPG